METVTAPNSDYDDLSISSAILMRFTDTALKEHIEIRKIIVGMAHGLVDQKVAPTAVAYLEATRSSLYQMSSSSKPEPVVIEALFTILSVLIPKVPASILMDKKKSEELVTDPLLRVLHLRSSSLTMNAGLLGLQCISQLLNIHRLNNSPWSDASPLFECLLGFTTSPVLHLRKPSARVIGEVLRSFRGSPHLLSPASEAVTNLFERWWLPVLGGGSNASFNGHTNAAAASALIKGGDLEYWYVLDVMTICVVLLPTNFKLAVLNYFRAIFDLILELEAHRPPITRRLESCLERVCLHPSQDVPPQLLLDLLCLVSLSVSRKLPHAHEGATTSRFLNSGVVNVYSSNREICVSQLPLVFDALKVLMGKPIEEDDGNIEEDIDAAAHTFKCLIHACIDQDLIKQKPTIIEKLCATIQSLLGYHRTNAPALSMDLAFEVVPAMLDKLGEYASYFMRSTLETLAHMHKLPDEEFPFRKQATLLLGTLVEEKCGLNDINIRAVLPQEQLMGLLGDYRGLKSKPRSLLSHRKRKMGLNITAFPPYDLSGRMMAEAATIKAISGAAQMTKKMKL